MPIMPPDKSQAIRIRLAITAIIAGLGILAIKYYASVISGSAALRADAIESVVNIVAAVFMLWALRVAGKPADKDHPYGHGKIEHFSAAFEGGLIALAAVFIAWEALTTLHEQFVEGIFKIKDLGRGIVWNAAAGVLNGALGIFLILMGRKHRSKAIEADGQHVLSDFWTTLGVLLGLLLVKLTGIQWLDPVLALLVATLLALTGFKLLGQSSQALLDMEDPKLLEQLIAAMNKIRPKDIIALHGLKTMRSGRHTHIDVHVVVPAHCALKAAHDLAESFGKRVIEEMGIEGEVNTHGEPCQSAMCQACAAACSKRDGPAGIQPALTVEDATVPEDEG
jgi:cation diffusion facilitator family transporter